MARARLLAVAALYAATLLAVAGLLASVLVAPMVQLGPLPVLFVAGYIALGALDSDGLEPKYVVPLGVCILVAGTYWGVGQLGPTLQFGGVVETVGLGAVQAAAAVLVVAVLVTVAVPLAVHRYAWRELRDTAVTDVDRTDALADRFAAHAPPRLDVAVLDDSDPAVYVVDDGRRAVLGFTAGATDVLDDHEREAVVARELTRVVDREALASFWASALAFAVSRLVDPVTTQVYDARAGGKVRLPYWFVAPLKLVAALLALFVLFVVPTGILGVVLDVNPFLVAFGYASGTLVTGFAITKAARWLARDIATDAVITADEHGAVLVGDAAPLAAALRKLHATDTDAATDELARDDDDGGDDNDRHEDTLDAFDGLVHFPTDRVAVADRLDALDAVADRLDDRPGGFDDTANTSS
ncbi:hypothetical protein [Halorubellus salinus]|uniref:hypothetical protein n=1 Tax=Halorubellus salinus TaxID=755309 RepID=UPI001D05D0C3|nr:hypothetical protein [Halorubellus salinus]